MNKLASDNTDFSDMLAEHQGEGHHGEGHATPSHSIARMREEAGALAPIDCERKRLIHREESVRQQSDAFRGIRTRLLEMAGETNFITLVVAVSPRSGGSFVTRNLAAAFAFDEAKTSLLMDCNLRYPNQHKALGIEPRTGGLIDFLEHPSRGIASIMYHTGVPRLRLIPAGKSRENSGEYFSSFRMRAVLDLAATKAGWSSTPLPPGKGRGIAVAEAFHTLVAQVAEVSVDKDGKVKVDRVVCAVDCGTPINPDVIAAQIEGGIGYGLGAALYGAITLKDGRVEQNNFDGYQVLRMNEMPKVEVHIVQSGAAPTGIGEPGVAPVGPAVANAIFAATGRRLRSLPIVKNGLDVA